MTKEEVLNTIIEHYKNGSTSALSDYCDRVRCADCPFNTEDCVDAVAMSLLERLLKTEESQKAETNLEHYFKNANVAIGKGFLNISFGDEVIEAFGNSKATYNVREWLLSPYEKSKYKLSKFEHDLLKCYHVSIYGIKDFWILEQMQDKGYFKDIPKETKIRDIIDNCEVIEE